MFGESIVNKEWIEKEKEKGYPWNITTFNDGDWCATLIEGEYVKIARIDYIGQSEDGSVSYYRFYGRCGNWEVENRIEKEPFTETRIINALRLIELYD